MACQITSQTNKNVSIADLVDKLLYLVYDKCAYHAPSISLCAADDPTNRLFVDNLDGYIARRRYL